MWHNLKWLLCHLNRIKWKHGFLYSCPSIWESFKPCTTIQKHIEKIQTPCIIKPSLPPTYPQDALQKLWTCWLLRGSPLWFVYRPYSFIRIHQTECRFCSSLICPFPRSRCIVTRHQRTALFVDKQWRQSPYHSAFVRPAVCRWSVYGGWVVATYNLYAPIWWIYGATHMVCARTPRQLLRHRSHKQI